MILWSGVAVLSGMGSVAFTGTGWMSSLERGQLPSLERGGCPLWILERGHGQLSSLERGQLPSLERGGCPLWSGVSGPLWLDMQSSSIQTICISLSFFRTRFLLVLGCFRFRRFASSVPDYKLSLLRIHYSRLGFFADSLGGLVLRHHEL